MSKFRSKFVTFFWSQKGRKILAAFALICVFCSLFCISSSAADEYVIKAGVYYSSSDPIIPDSSIVQDIDFGSLKCDDYDRFEINVAHFDEYPDVLYIYYCDVEDTFYNQAGSNEGNADGSTFWEDDGYRSLEVYEDTVVSYNFFIWFNAQYSVDSDYDDGFLAGWDDGYSVGYIEGKFAGEKSGYDSGYVSGYNTGYTDGIEIGRQATDSANFGQNLIGDTLNAPIRALNSFTLFTAPNGTTVTLGMVVGAMIALTLFIVFIRMFAGG